jgi:hypothetical protein
MRAALATDESAFYASRPCLRDNSKDKTMNFALTLSRWHNVAERLQGALKEREAAIKTAYTAMSISPWNKPDIEEKAANIARRAADDLAVVESGLQAIAAIRTALALRNAALGISARLAEADAAKRRAALYKAIIDGQKPDMVRPQHVGALPAEIIGERESWGFARRTALEVTVQTADDALLGDLRERLEREQARAVRLLDEVADLNRERLEIDLAPEIVRIAGLEE